MQMELKRKRKVHGLWNKGHTTQENEKVFMRLCREMRKAKAQAELSLAAAIKDKKPQKFL